MYPTFKELYKIALPPSVDKAPLYLQGQYNQLKDKVTVPLGEKLDLGTYFNAFPIAKWLNYTSINQLKVTLELKGNFHVDYYGMTATGETPIRAEEVGQRAEYSNPHYSLDTLPSALTFIGTRLTAMSDSAEFLGGSYQATFGTERDVKLGITICTFKREKYLLPNLDTLKTLTSRNPNISVMVIDNASTLGPISTPSLQIIHNPNFGGAGGFTRGLMEQINQGRNTHILLMDDDVDIELSAIERLYSMLRHLKPEHHDKFFAGAMLRLDKPTIQHENTAQFNGIIRRPFGHNFDLSDKSAFCLNEAVPMSPNTYAAWWMCCIPATRVKEIGYPLPIFIKCDDMEYSFRNSQEILTMTGVCVWHEPFENKANLIMGSYFGNRNTLLMNHFAQGCSRLTFATGVLGRIAKGLLNGNLNGLRMLELALKDLNTGLIGMTSEPADAKFASLKQYPLTKNIIEVIISIMDLTISHCINYNRHGTECKKFLQEKLRDQNFWRNFLDEGRVGARDK